MYLTPARAEALFADMGHFSISTIRVRLLATLLLGIATDGLHEARLAHEHSVHCRSTKVLRKCRIELGLDTPLVLP